MGRAGAWAFQKDNGGREGLVNRENWEKMVSLVLFFCLFVLDVADQKPVGSADGNDQEETRRGKGRNQRGEALSEELRAGIKCG